MPNSPGHTDGFAATQKYTYDQLNRIDDAAETVGSAQTWRHDFQYDRYGNRGLNETNTTTIPRQCGTPPSLIVCTADRQKYNPAADPGSNRLSSGQGYSYDASGNTTADPRSMTFTYDGENKQVEVRDTTITPTTSDPDADLIGRYWYDGDGKRVKKYAPPRGSHPGEITIFVYDAAGKQIAEYSTVVQTGTDAKVNYLTNDHLGSPRVSTDQSGAVISRHDYHPFGEEISTTQRTGHSEYAGDRVRKQFTGYERDKETELDFAQARMFSYGHGRFISPDPLYVEFRRLSYPQAWNLYVYARNNPLTFIDSDGLEVSVNCKTTKDQLKACHEQTTTNLNNRKDAQFSVEIKNGKLAVVGKVDISKLSKSERKLYESITNSFGKATLNVEMSSDKITFGRADAAGQNSIDLSDLNKLNASGNSALAGEVIAHEAVEGYESSLDMLDEDDVGLSYQQTGQFRRSHATANQFFGSVEVELSDASGLAGASVTSRDASYSFGRLGTSVTVTKKFKTPIPIASITRENFPNQIGDIDKAVVQKAPTKPK